MKSRHPASGCDVVDVVRDELCRRPVVGRAAARYAAEPALSAMALAQPENCGAVLSAPARELAVAVFASKLPAASRARTVKV